MCSPITLPESKPEFALSELIKKHTSVDIYPNLFKLFIKLYWVEITKLAHEIHESA